MAGLRLGVLGGTFDPVHVGHLILAESARTQLGLDRVLFIPAGDPWRKAAQPITAREHRLAMVERAVADSEWCEVSTVEIERPGPSYSVDTLVEIEEKYPGNELVFIVGEDALRDLSNWRDPLRILELATLAVAPRGERRPAAPELDALLPGLADHVIWIDMPRIDISATELRARAAQGRSLRYLVPGPVEEYIRERGLYQQS